MMKEIKIILDEDTQKWVLFLDGKPQMQSLKLEQITKSLHSLAFQKSLKNDE